MNHLKLVVPDSHCGLMIRRSSAGAGGGDGAGAAGAGAGAGAAAGNFVWRPLISKSNSPSCKPRLHAALAGTCATGKRSNFLLAEWWAVLACEMLVDRNRFSKFWFSQNSRLDSLQ